MTQPVIEKLMHSKGIKDVGDLTAEEKATVDRWQKILSEGGITVDKIRKFCENQIRTIEKQWRNLDNKPEKIERLVMVHTVYSMLLEVIGAPKHRRAELEEELNSLLEK